MHALSRPGIQRALLCLAFVPLAGCSLVGLGRIQPRHVEGSWTFRVSGSSACGVDSVAVQLRDGDRSWGSFFVSGDGKLMGVPGPPLTIGHGRVHPKSGDFTLVFRDRAPPRATRQFALEGTFDEAGGAVADYIRYLPEPECTVRMTGRRQP
ncbi:MAG TPA: hypothetical protein VE913_13980 [Longimicrobium sp.]|nr:hypothetical protein [Longimicrobium sp.]